MVLGFLLVVTLRRMSKFIYGEGDSIGRVAQEVIFRDGKGDQEIIYSYNVSGQVTSDAIAIVLNQNDQTVLNFQLPQLTVDWFNSLRGRRIKRLDLQVVLQTSVTTALVAVAGAPQLNRLANNIPIPVNIDVNGLISVPTFSFSDSNSVSVPVYLLGKTNSAAFAWAASLHFGLWYYP